MSWSQTQQTGDLYDQITIIVGSAIQLLGGNAGVFVVSNEAFDPQSNTEYTLYRLSEQASMLLLSYVQLGKQPSSKCRLATDTLPSTLVKQLGIYDEDAGIYGDGNEVAEAPALERCSLFLSDQAGLLGVLHYVRPAGSSSCIEHPGESDRSLRLFSAHLAAGLRSALKSQSLLKEQRWLAVTFQKGAGSIPTIDTALRIIDINHVMVRRKGLH